MGTNRAYSILEVKSVDGDERVFSGLATSPVPDRMGDIVDPMGIKFQNPLPLLWQHKHDQPIGLVTFDKPTPKGVTFTAKIPKIAEAGPLKDLVDMAWQAITARLVRGVSIGFRSLKHAYIDGGGIHFQESEVYELSAVTVPAHQLATIQAIKALDGGRTLVNGGIPLVKVQREVPKDFVRLVTP
jgi:HK97 family phage prohead protease